jgi:hypothetical protein
MENPLNKLIVPFLSLFISGALVIILHSCSQEKQAENKDSQQTEAVAAAWSASGEWVQKLTVSPTNIVRNTTWGQDFSSINDSLELAESQPERGKSFTLYFDDTDLNFSDITYLPNEQNKLQEITFDIFVDSADDVQPLIDQWKGYLEVKFGPSETKGTKVFWTNNKNTRITLENVSTPKDPGIKISFKAVH